MKWDDMPVDVRRIVLRKRTHAVMQESLETLSLKHASDVDVAKVLEMRRAATLLCDEYCLSICSYILTTVRIWNMMYS